MQRTDNGQGSSLERRVATLEGVVANHLAEQENRAGILLELMVVIDQLVDERDGIGRAIEAMGAKFSSELPDGATLKELLHRVEADVARAETGGRIELGEG